MTDTPKQTADTIEVVPYDPAWPQLYLAERALVQAAVGSRLLAFEHIGSTAVPGLPAKPIIDMMAAVADLREDLGALAPLATLGYQLMETGMPNRLFLRRHRSQSGLAFHLHVVEQAGRGGPASAFVASSSIGAIQFVNNSSGACEGHRSSLSGAAIADSETFRGTGILAQFNITLGVFLRF